jgi:hypothetical protein
VEHLYTLAPDGRPVLEPDVLAWGAWYARANVTLAHDRAALVTVCTYFLGRAPDPPLLWETLVCDGPRMRTQRYASREEALAGHARWLERVRAGTWLEK